MLFCSNFAFLSPTGKMCQVYASGKTPPTASAWKGNLQLLYYFYLIKLIKYLKVDS